MTGRVEQWWHAAANWTFAKKDDGADANDLSKANMPKSGSEMPDQLDGTHATGSSPSPLETEPGKLRGAIPVLRALCDRHRLAADVGKERSDITDDERHTMVRAAKIIRSLHDQTQAPPVDQDLVRMATWNQLPNDLAIAVQRSGIQWQDWNDALRAEEKRAIAIQDAAESD